MTNYIENVRGYAKIIVYPRFDVCLYIRTFTHRCFELCKVTSATIMAHPTEEEAIINFLSQSNCSKTLDDKVNELISIYSELNRKLPPHFSKLVAAAHVIRLRKKLKLIQ